MDGGVLSGGSRRAVSLLTLRSPDGQSATVVVQAKSSIEARDLPQLASQVRRSLEREAAPRLVGGLIAGRYLNSRIRQRLVDEGLNYADATGNVFLALGSPGLFLRDVGATTDPWRGPGRPRDSFRGSVAGRVVRALADFALPLTVPELIDRSGVSTGAAYRVVAFLERQGLLERRPRGPIAWVDWRPMIEGWGRDYELNLGEPALRLLAPRGIEQVREALSRTDGLPYVLTGSAGAAYFEEYAQVRLATIYTDDPEQLADRLDLRPVASGANVLLLRPPDDFVYDRAVERDGVLVAAPSQLVVDLLNGPGRAPSEAQSLLDWMEENESAWRR